MVESESENPNIIHAIVGGMVANTNVFFRPIVSLNIQPITAANGWTPDAKLAVKDQKVDVRKLWSSWNILIQYLSTMPEKE